MRWLCVITVVIPFTAAFMCTIRQPMNHIPQYQHLRCSPLRATSIHGRSLLFVDETVDTSITAATTITTTTTTTREARLTRKKKPATFSSTTPTDKITTKQPVVVNEEESHHGDDEEDEDHDGDANASTTSISKQKRGSKSSPSPIFRVVPARPMVPATNGSSSSLSSSIMFTVYGEPVPLSRHMVSRGRMYNPSAKLQKEFAAACVDHLPLVPLAGPLEATLLFYFKRPKNQYGTGKNAHILKPAVVAAGVWHSKRKDLDNLVKFVLDSLNGKAYEDDAQIAAITCAKFYTEDDCGRTEVIIKSLTGHEVMTRKYEDSGVETYDDR